MPPLEDPPRPPPAPSPLPPRAVEDCDPLATAATAAATPPLPRVDDTAPPRSPHPLPNLPPCVDAAAPAADLLLSLVPRPPAPVAPRLVPRLLPLTPPLPALTLGVVVAGATTAFSPPRADAGAGADADKLASDFFCAAAKACRAMRPAPGTSPSSRLPAAAGPDDGGAAGGCGGCGCGGVGLDTGVVVVGAAAVPAVEEGLGPRLLRLFRDDLPPRPRPLPLPLPELPLPLPPPVPDELIVSTGIDRASVVRLG